MPDNLDNLMAQVNNPFKSTPQPTAQQPTQPAKPKPAAEGAIGSALTGVGDALTFGLLDEASALGETLIGNIGQPTQSMWTSGKGFADTFAANLAFERGLQKADAEAHPVAYHGGQIGGAFLIPAGVGAQGALQVARTGALQGAAYGAGSADGGLGDRAAGAVEGGVMGAAVATALHPIIQGASSLVGKLLGRGAKGAEEDAGVLTGAVHDDTPPGTPIGDSPNATPSETGPADPVPPTPADATTGTPETPATAWTSPDANGNRAPITTIEHLGPTPEGDAPIPLHAEGTPEAPAGEPVGSISRAGLEDLQAKVQQFRESVGKENGRAVDITPNSPEHPTLGAFRLGNLGDGPETMSLLGALVRQLPGVAPKSDPEMWAAARAAAKDIGTNDPEALHALASQMAGPEGNIEGAIALLRTVQRQAADTVDAFHGAGVDWATASDAMVQEVGQAIYNVQRINELVQSAKVGVGRALRVFSLPNSEAYFQAMARGESITPAAERSVPPLPATREEMHQFFELWGMAKGNPELQNDLLQGTLTVPTAGHYLASSFANFFTASILSAPKTAMLNVVGPVFINTIRSLEKMSGAAVLALDPTISAAQRAEYAATAKYTPIALFKTFGDIADVFRYGVQAFKENHSVLGGGGTVRDANISFGPYNSNLLNAAGVDPNWQYSLGNLINVWPKAFARVNAGLDEMAKRYTYLAEARVRAMVDASSKGLEGDAFHEAVSNALKGAVDEAGAATNQGILDAAERTTLTGRVSTEGTAVRGFTDYIQTLRHDYPLMRFILPVFNVPANALGETLKRVPGADLMPAMTTHVADLAGENGAVAQAEAHGRTLLGGAFLSAGYLMNQAGLLTGAGPQKPKDRAVWLQTHQPYSIRVGDTWVSYRKLDILGGLLSIPASISDFSVFHKMDQGDQQNMAMAGAAALATWFKDQAAMRTATQLLTLGDIPTQDPGKAVESIFGQIAAGMVPASGFIRTMGVDTTDPYSRMKRGWEDYVKSVIPGLSQELEPLRNVLGEPINRPNNTVGEAVFPISLAPVATWKEEPVLNELSRLYQKTGYAAGADPRSVLFGFKDAQDVKLEDGQSLYSHLVQPRATFKLDGMTLKEALADLFKSPEYKAAVDADSGQAVTSLGDQSRAALVGEVFRRYGTAIKAEVADASPIALKYMTAAAAKHRDDAYLHTIPLEDLVNNPALYDAHGVDAQSYSDQITAGAAGQLATALKK